MEFSDEQKEAISNIRSSNRTPPPLGKIQAMESFEDFRARRRENNAAMKKRVKLGSRMLFLSAVVMNVGTDARPHWIKRNYAPKGVMAVQLTNGRVGYVARGVRNA